tara:strand:- start:3529 stop:8157 length:4629 start_codon:yes stop_codon:yes gene_type:complete
MPEIKNNFLKGRMNQDLDSRILPSGEYREAINLLISRSEGATVGEFENILGNTSVGTVSSAKKLFVIGNFVDETNNNIYIFATDFSDTNPFSKATSLSTCQILEFDLDNPGNPTILVDGYFLNFNKKFPLYGVNLLEELLFWTDNLNQPRRINITTARNNVSAYTEEVQISVAKYYPYNPLIPLSRQTATTTAGCTSTLIVLSSGNTNIKVGDIVTDNDKTDFANLVIGNSTPPVKVTQILDQAATKFEVSPAISSGAPASGVKLDFSRTSMENHSEQYKSNWSSQTIGTIMTAGSGGTSSDRTGTKTSIRIDADAVLGGVPRVGDIITNVTSPNNIPNASNPTTNCNFNVRVESFDVDQVSITNSGRWTIHCDVDATFDGALTGFSTSDVIRIGNNPLYESNFSGDTKFLDDKFVRFSYRFKFNDNEYSLMAPFSQVMFVPKQYGEFGLGQIDTQVDNINNYYQDEVDAYTSTILQWFENNVDTVELKIPLPDTLANTSSIYNIKKIDILYKESNAAAVKVLDTIVVSDLVANNTSTINYNDDIHGLIDQLFYNYTYESNKPYKTLPENQTTRVYDKVPVKSLAQEIISNRIVYGNFTERMTPPSSINYQASYTPRDMQASDYAIEYPYHTVKQNRTYQVGFVLADKYGRQSDVILSSNDAKSDTKGSSVYIPYRDSGDASSSPVIDWLGTNLTLNIEEAIGTAIDNNAGQPGVYKENGHVASIITITDGDSDYVANTTYTTNGGSGSGCTVRVTSVGVGGAITSLVVVSSGSGYTQGNELTINGGGSSGTFTVNIGEANPLGWYSYKVVVKQQEQEYYNVFFPGFINGLPINDKIWNKVPRNANLTISPGTTDVDPKRGKIFFSSLLADNINKIPRNLKEVGPTDVEFNSDEILYVRVNNPNVTSTLEVRNLQYYPGQILQNVLNIATARDTELAPIPFVPFSISPDPSVMTPVEVGEKVWAYNQTYPAGNKGDYGSTLRYTPQGTDSAKGVTVTVPTGSIPWGDVADKESFFQADQNPFIIKIGQVSNYDNAVGAIVCGGPLFTAVPHDSNYASGVRTMEPTLSIAETKPVFSKLAIFWETSSSGKLEELNAAINTNDNGAVQVDASSGTFPESTVTLANVGPQFQFIDGSGALITNVSGTPTVTKVYRQNDIAKTQINPGFFTVSTVIANTKFQLTTAKTFWYSVNSNNDPSSDIYIFDLEVTSGPSAEYTRSIPAAITLTLTNTDPIIYYDSGYSTNITGTTKAIANPTVDATNIVQLYGLNGSSDTTGTPANRTRELVWAITAILPGKLGSLSDFSIDSTGLVTSNTTMTNEGAYGLTLTLTDVNNTGSNKETVTCNIAWTAGTQYAPKIIGTGNTLAGNPGYMTGVGARGEYRFTNDSYSIGTVDANGYPLGWSAASFVYNAQTEYNADYGTSCRADMFQGTITIKPKMFNTSTVAGDATILFTIQYRSSSSNNWVNINTVAGSTNTWTSSTSYATFNHSTTGAGTSTLSYKFDQLGEYRVVTNSLGGAGGGVATFTVDYEDGAYNLTASGPCAP